MTESGHAENYVYLERPAATRVSIKQAFGGFLFPPALLLSFLFSLNLPHNWHKDFRLHACMKIANHKKSVISCQYNINMTSPRITFLKTKVWS